MLRNFVVFMLFVLGGGQIAWANPIDDMLNHPTDSNMAYFKQNKEWREREFARIEVDMKQMNPELVQRLAQYPDDVKIGEYKTWLAIQTFEEFFDKYMADLKQMSQETGRPVVTTDQAKAAGESSLYIDMEYTLSDEGIRTKCVKEPLLGDTLCYYPDGYVEYTIRYISDENNPDQSLSHTRRLEVTKDVPSENTRYEYSFFLSGADSDPFMDVDKGLEYSRDMHFSYFIDETDYDKFHKWRNDSVDDLLSDMCRIVCKNCWDGWRYATTIECKADKTKYKSDTIPGFKVRGINDEYSLYYTDSRFRIK